VIIDVSLDYHVKLDLLGGLYYKVII